MQKKNTGLNKTKPFVSLSMLGVFILVVILSNPIKARSVVYVEPTGSPPVSNDISAPLNVSSTTQTKIGDLTLNNGLTIGNNADLNVYGAICWNDDCKYNWGDVVGIPDVEKFVHLTNPRTGWVDLRGRQNLESYNLWTLKLVSSDPTVAVPRAGAYGLDDDAIAFDSYGVAGFATQNVNKSMGIYGISAVAEPSWAGYFNGNVAISSPGDLIIGQDTSGNDPNVSELCINGECRSAILLSGDQYWTDVITGLQAKDSGHNLAIGGQDSRASFYVQNNTARSTVTLNVNGVGNSYELML